MVKRGTINYTTSTQDYSFIIGINRFDKKVNPTRAGVVLLLLYSQAKALQINVECQIYKHR